MSENTIHYLGGNVTIMVSSMAKAVKFYTETLGLELKVRHSSHWAEVGNSGITIGLHPKTKNKTITQGDSITIGLEVADIDAAVKELQNKGLELMVQKDSQVYMAYFNDPDDNVLYFFQYKKPQPGK